MYNNTMMSLVNTMVQCTGVLLMGMATFHKEKTDGNIIRLFGLSLVCYPVVFSIVDRCINKNK